MNKETIVSRIESYFKDALIHVHVTDLGGLYDIEIQYRDFLPIPVVRRWVDDHVKNVYGLDIERIYSKTVMDSPSVTAAIELHLFNKSFT